MTRWRIDDDGKTRELTEQELREKLRRGKLSGVELARPEGEEGWRPLHAWPLFQEEVAVSGGDTELAALDRRAKGFAAHFVVFVMVMLGLTAAQGHLPSWWVWWALGLGIQGITAVPAIIQRIQRRHASQAAQAVEALDPTLDGEVDPQLVDLHAALASLDAAARDSGEAPDIDLAAVRQAGATLAARRARLAAALPEGGAVALEQALAAAEIRSAASPDVEDYAAEVRALAQRLSGLRQAEASLDRLRARERALLHEVESLRLVVLQADARDAEAPAVGDAVRRLRSEVEAVEEVDETLRRARAAAAAPRRRS